MNQPNQQPPGNRVPDHRLDEIMAEVRQMREENQRLRDHINYIEGRTAQPNQPQEPDEPAFTPEIEQALEKKLAKKIRQAVEPLKTDYTGKLGFLHEENDALKFQVKWGAEVEKKYGQKIDQFRNEARRRGQWVSREDAYKHIYFEETARKPQEKPMAPQNPTFARDPYTGMPLSYEEQQQPQQPQPQQQAVQPPVQQPPQQQAHQEIDPDFGLPPAGPTNPNTRPAPSQGFQRPVMSDAPDEAALDAWASKYGDVPL